MAKYLVNARIWSLQHQAEFEPGAEVELDGDMAELVADGVLEEIKAELPAAIPDEAVEKELTAKSATGSRGAKSAKIS